MPELHFTPYSLLNGPKCFFLSLAPPKLEDPDICHWIELTQAQCMLNRTPKFNINILAKCDCWFFHINGLPESPSISYHTLKKYKLNAMVYICHYWLLAPSPIPNNIIIATKENTKKKRIYGGTIFQGTHINIVGAKIELIYLPFQV